MNIFEVFTLVGSNVWLYGGAFLLVLSILVFVHEWGHYIVARWCGIRVEIFSIGFGKELFGWTDKHGTRWKWSLVPLGGYVKMFGDVDPASSTHDDTVKDEKSGVERTMTENEKSVAFFAKPVAKRAAVVVAGPAINYIFAIILLSGLFIWNGKPVTPPSAGAVIEGSSADRAGFKPGDLILSIDGRAIEDFDEIRRDMMIGLDTKKIFKVQRGSEILDLAATPDRMEEEDRFGFKHSRGVLGLMSPMSAIEISKVVGINGVAVDGSKNPEQVRSIAQRRMGETVRFDLVYGTAEKPEKRTYIMNVAQEYNLKLQEDTALESNFIFASSKSTQDFKRYGPVEAVGKALEESWSITRGTLEAIGQIIVGTRSTKELGGIVRIGAMAGDMAKQGIIALILFTALLSINLGLINMMPIPLLDGGHLVFYGLEAMLGKPVPEKIQEYAFRVGFVFLIGVMVFANLNDILQMIL